MHPLLDGMGKIEAFRRDVIAIVREASEMTRGPTCVCPHEFSRMALIECGCVVVRMICRTRSYASCACVALLECGCVVVRMICHTRSYASCACVGADDLSC